MRDRGMGIRREVEGCFIRDVVEDDDGFGGWFGNNGWGNGMDSWVLREKCWEEMLEMHTYRKKLVLHVCTGGMGILDLHSSPGITC